MDQGDELNNLAKQDLGLQTEFQKDAMQRYGNNVIMMDATHSTTQYDFLLITISVIDEFGAGLPVAWAISNREDTAALIESLNANHQRVGDLKPTYFMSEYFNAWGGVFGNTATMLSKFSCR